MIRHCIHLPLDTCYETAVKLLNNRYGNPHYLLASYRKEIKALPSVKPGDASGFRMFYNFVLKCETFAKSTNWNALETPETLCILVSKLPGGLRDRWNRKVQVVRRNFGREPCLSDFSSFVHEETTLVNDPIFSKDAVQEYVQIPERNYDKKKRYGSFATKGGEVIKCALCEGSHNLDDCSTFLQFNLQERSKWLFHNKLCYGCLSTISVNHNARNCKNRKECKICKKRHPTSLHGYKAEKFKNKEVDTDSRDDPKVNVNCATANTKSDLISMCVVPVVVRHKLSNHFVKTYAMLDNCSQATFMQDKLLADLGLHGRKTSITVKTMNGEVTKSSEVLDDIEVAQASDEKEEKVWIKLPSTYTQKDLPVDSREVATAEKLKKWKYLDRLKPFMNLDDKKEVSLLIGANCVRALEPRKVISSKHGGPYAFKTLLGWCVVGPMSKQNKPDKFGCNRIMVTSADTMKPGSHYFHVPTEVKETSIESMLKKIYEHDFVEPDSLYCINNKINLNYDNLSKNDKRFLDIMETEAVKIDGHYQLPLPLKDKEVMFPDNRMLAMKRMQSLKKRFERDEQFYNQYKSFMDDLLDKGYARKCVNAGPEGKTWYIPHHGVLQPRKGNIRVVFDCSSQYKGTSLNQHLLSGPDLTNQLVGVLHRFRLEQVAFMADIQKMFYQVKVPEIQRSYLRHLWWNDSNINSDIIDQEMCVHLFGAVSSPGSSNYAFRRNGVDNSNRYGIDALETILKNFYVDDCLKSVEDEKYAIDLIRRVMAMCAAGGFNLTKFICNRRNVLMSIPDSHRREGVKDADLVNEELPTERALGVSWGVEKDVLCFKVNLKES